MDKKLIFNGKEYASLGSSNTANCNGLFTQSRNGDVKLFKLGGELVALIVNNQKQGQFVVSAGLDSDGKEFYMFSSTTLTQRWLGLEGIGLSARSDAVMRMRLVGEVADQSAEQPESAHA